MTHLVHVEQTYIDPFTKNHQPYGDPVPRIKAAIGTAKDEGNTPVIALFEKNKKGMDSIQLSVTESTIPLPPVVMTLGAGALTARPAQFEILSFNSQNHLALERLKVFCVQSLELFQQLSQLI